MNRFRTKRRAKDTGDLSEANDRSDSPSVPTLKPSKTFRLGRKNVPEPERKLELDLSTALPSSDDFRTSLLMSGLSARFSMLREQDDPKSKIGKASDDSVLFPKRQSRLNDFGFQSHGLHDIAEVSSIRAPFASNRVDSFHSADTNYEDGGSIMSRAKPGEGNNLFGGRQKIYKIPAGANGDAKGMGGRALYDDDVSLSAFQKLREREREQRAREEQEAEQQERDDVEQSLFPLRSTSPPLIGYNRNRETSSTTSSGPSLTRSSTAATSVTSQRTPSVNGHSSPSTPAIPSQSNGIDRSMTKGKRLYETGLDHHLHSQQYSAMNRLDTLSRQQTLGARTPSPGGYAAPDANGYESIHANGSTTHHVAIQTTGLPATATSMGTFDFGVKPPASPLETQRSLFMAAPLSPPMSDGDDQSSLAIQPNDRGKATALGAFSKPVQPYDEKKYMQRQLQMQQGRETPPLRKHSPPRAFNSRQQNSGRSRTESTSTYSSTSSRSSSSAQSQYVGQNRMMASQAEGEEMSEAEDRQISTGPFLRSPNGAPFTSKDGNYKNGRSWAPASPQKLDNTKLSTSPRAVERPLDSQHPANRQPNPKPHVDCTADQEEPKTQSIPAVAALTVAEKRRSEHKDPAADSPTLGPANGLSGLVRQHLRTDSNTSSIYGAPSPGLNSFLPQSEPEPANDHSYNSKGNPWEINDWDQGTNEHAPSNGTSKAGSPNKQFSTESPRTTKSSKNIKQGNQNNSWEDEATHHHVRNGSTETQKERVDFANELASARRRVQENLKSFAESDSRSVSPGPGTESERDGFSMNPIGMLRSKSSRDSILAKSRNSQSKAMKMLGISSSTVTRSPSPGKQRIDDDLWKQEEEEMLHGVKPQKSPPPTKAFRQARRDAQRERERQILLRRQQQQQQQQPSRGTRSSGDSDEASHFPSEMHLRQRQPSRETEHGAYTQRRAPSQESKSSGAPTNNSNSRPPSRNARDRSGSDASGRSKSRNGRYRNEMGNGISEDASSSRGPSRSPAVPQTNGAFSSAAPSTGRSRSDSKSTPAGYFDSDQVQQIHSIHQMDMGMAPRPSPVQPYAINATPALAHPSSPFASGANTPTSQGFQSQQGRLPANLKRNVNKSDISEPKLMSKTSHIVTVDLPSGASLQNGMPHSAPPLPPQDPRRRQTRAQAMFGLIGKGNDAPPTISKPMPAYYVEDTGFYPTEEVDQNPKSRQKLRKSSSEGGNMNARARQVFAAAGSPAVPTFPAMKSREGVMF